MAAYDQFDDLALQLPLEAVLPVFAATDTAQMAQTAMHAPGNPERIILWPLDLGGISAHRFTSESYSVNPYFLLPLPTLPASRPMISAATAIRKITRKPFPRLFGLGVAVPTVIWGLLAKRRPIMATMAMPSTRPGMIPRNRSVGGPVVLKALLPTRNPRTMAAIRAIIATTSTWLGPGAGGRVLGPTAPSVRKFVP